MTHYYLIDDATNSRGRCDAEIINADSDEKAIIYAGFRWSYLTESEKKARDAFYVIEAEPLDGDDDIPNEDTARTVKVIK